MEVLVAELSAVVTIVIHSVDMWNLSGHICFVCREFRLYFLPMAPTLLRWARGGPCEEYLKILQGNYFMVALGYETSDRLS